MNRAIGVKKSGTKKWTKMEHFGPFCRGRTNRVFGKPCFCPLPKRGRFDENGENDEFAFYPLKKRVSLLRPPQTTKMTKMADVTQEKAWFRKSRVCSSLILVSRMLKSGSEYLRETEVQRRRGMTSPDPEKIPEPLRGPLRGFPVGMPIRRKTPKSP